MHIELANLRIYIIYTTQSSIHSQYIIFTIFEVKSFPIKHNGKNIT